MHVCNRTSRHGLCLLPLLLALFGGDNVADGEDNLADGDDVEDSSDMALDMVK